MNIYFRVFFPLMLLFAFKTTYAAGPFLGCADFCRSRYQVGSKAYDNCLVQTQSEGRCGGTPKSSGSKSNGGQTSTRQSSCERTRQECDRSGGTFTNNDGVCSCVAGGGESATDNSQVHPSCRPGALSCRGDEDRVENSDGTCSCSDGSSGEPPKKESDDAVDTMGPPASAALCGQEYNQLNQDCEKEIQETSYVCDEKNDSGMNSATDTASQLALALGQQTSASIMAACSKMAGVAQAANAALAAYRLNCSSAINSCRSACSRVKKYIQDNSQCLESATGKTSTFLTSVADVVTQNCTEFENKTNQAQQAIQNYGATSANAAQCAALTSGDPGTLAAYCAKNPTQLVCQTAQAADCSNPQVAATNKICICAKNPNDPSCLKGQKPTDPRTIGGTIDSSSRLANKASADYSGDIPNLPPIMPGQRGSGGGESIDGSQGGAGVGGGGGGSAAGGGGGGGSAAERTANINGGFYGGGGNRFGYGGSGGGGGAGGRGYAVSSGRNTASGPDLRKFLPGGQYDPRRAAGVSGPDGITGPHSNIWQKVQNRYRVMSPSLLP